MYSTGNALIAERNMAEMHMPQTAGRNWNPDTVQSSYGLGWFIHDYRGLHLVSHGGAIDGFRASITLLPGETLDAMLMAGRSAARERAAGHVGTKRWHALAAYTGTYRDAGYGDVQITVENGALALAWSSFHTPLDHSHNATFDVRSGRLNGSQVVFLPSASGEISGLSFLDVDFTKGKIK